MAIFIFVLEIAALVVNSFFLVLVPLEIGLNMAAGMAPHPIVAVAAFGLGKMKLIGLCALSILSIGAIAYSVIRRKNPKRRGLRKADLVLGIVNLAFAVLTFILSFDLIRLGMRY